MKSLFLKTAAAMAALSVAMPAMATVYSFDRAVGGQQVSGFIETDGTIGVLSDANIVDYGFSFAGLSFSRGVSAIVGSNLSATASDLIYDFSSTARDYAIFFGERGGDPYAGYFCYQNNGCFDFDGSGIGIGYDPAGRTPVLSGSQVVASVAVNAVPEPAVWAMMIVGMGLAGSELRRRRAKMSVRYA